ncbi:MAG: transcriptional repressor, partial [Pseudomonadota bacterium]|nr:transcriptional repressor [Pseudomonadota bacterium]
MTPTSADIATDWLVSAGLRPTRQRVALAELLVGDGKHRHVTAESLFDAAKDKG